MVWKIDQFATYKNGDRKTQIDFLMCRKSQLREIKNCKVINGESVAVQHKLVVLDWEMKGVKNNWNNPIFSHPTCHPYPYSKRRLDQSMDRDDRWDG